ncbi:MAG TPA: hypothetical protein VF400_06455 [Anaeromyxobacteraceae bacterium]
MSQAERPEFVKEVVQLADGRRLIYYWFASSSPRPRPPGKPEDPRAPRPGGA